MRTREGKPRLNLIFSFVFGSFLFMFSGCESPSSPDPAGVSNSSGEVATPDPTLSDASSTQGAGPTWFPPLSNPPGGQVETQVQVTPEAHAQVTAELKTVVQALNTSPTYALSSEDIQLLKEAEVLGDGDDSTLLSFIQ